MSWSLDKENHLRELTAQGVPYADALAALSKADTPAQVRDTSERLSAAARSSTEEKRS